jgi:hypothetical protein
MGSVIDTAKGEPAMNPLPPVISTALDTAPALSGTAVVAAILVAVSAAVFMVAAFRAARRSPDVALSLPTPGAGEVELRDAA